MFVKIKFILVVYEPSGRILAYNYYVAHKSSCYKIFILYYWLLMEEPNNKATITFWVLRRGHLPSLYNVSDAPLIHTHSEKDKG